MTTIQALPDREIKAAQDTLAPLTPRWIDLPSQVQEAAQSDDNAVVWIIRKSQLADRLVRELSWPNRKVGNILLIGPSRPEILPALSRRFEHVVYSFDGGEFLPRGELDSVFSSLERQDRLIGGVADSQTKTVILWRGDLTPLVVPFASFEPAANGTRPAWDKFAVTDYGQTLKFGDYEAAADAVLYENDADFRRRLNKARIATERSLGASIRRLRLQRRLTRHDFAAVDPKTLARIERGEVRTPRPGTIHAIAGRLGVAADKLSTY